MKIKYRGNFNKHILEIIDYIAKDSNERAYKFYEELTQKIRNIEFMPYRYRKNPQLNRDDVRDLIYKGYVVPFRVLSDTIYILDIYKRSEWSGEIN